VDSPRNLGIQRSYGVESPPHLMTLALAITAWKSKSDAKAAKRTGRKHPGRGHRITSLEDQHMQTMTRVHNVHPDHAHDHRPGCGHVAFRHEDHVDYVHDAHLHRGHEGHTDECESGEHLVHDGHTHHHGPNCGHVAVPHGDHTDYVHDGHRHAAHGDHWDDH
jgi:hypothetical protein